MPDEPNDVGSVYVENELLRRGFTVVPVSIIRRPNLSAGAKLAYIVLLSYAWEKDSCFPGQVRMAEDMGVTDRTVRTYIADLVKAGLVIVKQRGLNQTNVYLLPERPLLDSASGPERKESSGPERITRSGQGRKNFPTKKDPVKTTNSFIWEELTKEEQEAYEERNRHAGWLITGEVPDAPP